MPQVDLNVVSRSFDNFSSIILNRVKTNKVVNPVQFTNDLRDFGDKFIAQEQKQVMNRKSKWLAETLVGLKNLNLAGRVYSYLIKFNKGNNKMIEEFAQNGLIIAKRLSDPLHIMARANDLKEIYKYTKPASDKHLRVLYDEKRALSDIVKDYEGARKRNVATTRDLRPVDSYEEKLAAIKVEIAEVLIKREDFTNAKIELKEALAMYEKIGEGPNSEKIRNILKNL